MRPRPQILYRAFVEEPYVGPHVGNTGTHAETRAQHEAEESSRALRDATLRAIIAHADRHGTDIDTAATCLISRGEMPRRFMLAGRG